MAVVQKYNYGPLFTPESLQKPSIEDARHAGGELVGSGVRPRDWNWRRLVGDAAL